MITEFETDSFTVKFDDTPELREKVFEKVLAWYKEYQAFHGECIMQSDDPQIYAPVLMGEMADDLFKFDVNVK